MQEKYIGPKEMELVGDLYNTAFHRVFDNLSETSQEHVAAFWLSIVAGTKPYLLVTENGLVKARDRVFSDPELTDFMLSFTFVFFSLFAGSVEERKALIDHIANSVSSHFGSPSMTMSYVAIPTELSDRMAGPTDTVAVLSSNTWLLMMVMAPVFTNYRELLPKPKMAKRSDVDR